MNLFIGVEALHDSTSLYLSQQRYVIDVLVRSGMYKAKSCRTPMATSINLSKQESPNYVDPNLYIIIIGSLHYLYIIIIGSLHYLSFTRDIAFAVHHM